MRKTKMPKPISLREMAGRGSEGVITHLSWAADILTDSESERSLKANAILQDIARFNSKDGRPTPEGLKMAREFSDPLKYQLIGFVNMVSYIKAQGRKQDLQTTYIHPLSEALLLFKKDSCCLVIAGADVRFGQSYLSEVKANSVHHDWLESGDGIKS